MKWWDLMPWYKFSECWVLSQLFTLLFHSHQEVLWFIFTFFHKLSTRCLYFSLIKGNKREKDLEVLYVENWHWWSQRQKCWGIFPQKLITWGLSTPNRIYLKSQMHVTLRCLLWKGNSQVGYMVSMCVCVCVCVCPCTLNRSAVSDSLQPHGL